MSQVTHKPAGWKLVGVISGAIGVLAAVQFLIFPTAGEALAAVIRWTARTSFILFLTAFSASSLRVHWPSAATRWLLANRRYVGVSFAVSHLIHAAAILASAALSRGESVGERGVADVLPGTVTYLFILAMLATSFDRSAAWLGPRRWRALHTVGAYVIFLTFLGAYGGRALEGVWHIPHVLLLAAVLGLRWTRKWRRR